jgi:ribosomal-protein-alanine N-acetyltransferase
MTAIRAMGLDDIPQVMEIDRLSFPLPWSENSFRKELAENEHAYFFVAEAQGGIVGFAGYWYIVDECHISTLAVHPAQRGQGIGDLLLAAALRHALALGAALATLEVRESNVAAQTLYRKYGFEVAGRRRRYYRNNDEDALLMTAQPVRLQGAESQGLSNDKGR